MIKKIKRLYREEHEKLGMILWGVLFFPIHAFLWILPTAGIIYWWLSEIIFVIIIAIWTSPYWVKAVENKKKQNYYKAALLKLCKIKKGALSVNDRQSGELSVNNQSGCLSEMTK